MICQFRSPGENNSGAGVKFSVMVKTTGFLIISIEIEMELPESWMKFSVMRRDDGDSSLITIHVAGTGFLYNMVQPLFPAP